MKKFLSIFLTIVLIAAMMLELTMADTKEPSQKEEVVYGLLDSDGSIQNIYVVNSFDGGMITDHGNYTRVENLMTAEEINVRDDTITVNTKEKRFYYQGIPESKMLPWIIEIKYQLDNEDILPAQLAGESGVVGIFMSVRENTKVDPVFYENYMLQITFRLDSYKFTDITSPNAMIATAGRNKLIVHTIMPSSDADISLKASVWDFEIDGIEISGIPALLPIQLPELDSLNGDLSRLIGAVGELNDGMGELSKGISEMSQGADQLAAGSKDFKNGLLSLKENSNNIIGASNNIKGALSNASKQLDSSSDIDINELALLPEGLRQVADGLNEMVDVINTFKESYNTAHMVLDSAIAQIPEAEIDPSDLYEHIQGNEELIDAVDGLVEYYKAAKLVKGTYVKAGQVFSSAVVLFDEISGSIDTSKLALLDIADKTEQAFGMITDAFSQIDSLKDGLLLLSKNYNEFHTGLAGYMNSISSLYDGYSQLDSGITAAADGMINLDVGADNIYKGVGELYNAVIYLPDQIQEQLAEFIEAYDKSDFVPVSFVSEKNTNVSAVQFVLKTAPIKLVEEAEEIKEEPEELNFWQRILRLFGL